MAEHRYWDSNCFLAWLQNEAGTVEQCQSVLDLAEHGTINIVTSVLTLVEVLRWYPMDASPSERRWSVVSLFNRPSIQTINLTRPIAERARDLAWEHRIVPADAIHVASALFAKVDMLNTFDGSLIGKSGLIGRPPLVIQKPIVAEPELPLH